MFSDRSKSSEEHLRETFANCRAFEKSVSALHPFILILYIIEQPEVLRTGKLPRKEINDAIDAITLVIMKKLSFSRPNSKRRKQRFVHAIENVFEDYTKEIRHPIRGKA